MDAFKIPPTIPQDLLLIHDIIGVPSTVPSSNIVKKAVEAADDSIDSSGSELESEDEIEADLMALADEEVPDSSAASDSSSDSDSESESEQSSPREKALEVADLDDEEDGGPALTSGSYFQTKNEVAEADIIVPTIAEVGAEELLEKVGEIMSVMGNTVIIKGIPSEVADRGSDRALDSDTLLVFEDRKVMGYVYETFGPTSQPFYQVKFNTAFPLDSEKVQVSHDIFHVPTRSNFVFTSQLKKLKGSDASNVHDEEPADHELEFSDDEAEAAHKASMKRKRGESRSHSVAASSRHTSPVPSQSYDMEQTAHFSRNPYDEHGPYDVDFGAGPSRPPPMPYDDPYADNFLSTSDVPQRQVEDFEHSSKDAREFLGSGGRSRGSGRERGDSGRRGRGRGRGRNDHGPRGNSRSEGRRRSGDAVDIPWSDHNHTQQTISNDSQRARPHSPTSFAIARTTGQLPGGSYHPNTPQFASQPLNSPRWGYPDAFQANTMFQFGGTRYPPGFVQPHINPRFASTFGMNMGMVAPSSQYQVQNHAANSSNPHWTSEWAVTTGSGNMHAYDQASSDVNDSPN